MHTRIATAAGTKTETEPRQDGARVGGPPTELRTPLHRPRGGNQKSQAVAGHRYTRDMWQPASEAKEASRTTRGSSPH